MSPKPRFLIWWLGGLAIFAVSLALHAPLAIEAVPRGILDHRAALASRMVPSKFAGFFAVLVGPIAALIIERSWNNSKA